MDYRDELEKYLRLDKVGEGTYGVVYKCQNKETNELVALKKVRLENEDEGIPSTSIREISILKQLHHPNIVNLLDLIHGEKKLYLVFEFMDHDLKKYLDLNGGPLPPQLVKSYLYQICLAIKYCHSRRILHRDLKPQNLLIDKNGVIKLGDFGLSRFLNSGKEPTHGRIGTPHWMAPEILKGGTYQFPADIFSYGMILWELITYKIPYHNIDPMKIVDLITKEKKIVKVPNEGNPVLRRIAQRCIQYEPRDRPSLDVVLEVLGKVNKENSLVDNCTEEIYEFIS